jgi:hypothetical protein
MAVKITETTECVDEGSNVRSDDGLRLVAHTRYCATPRTGTVNALSYDAGALRYGGALAGGGSAHQSIQERERDKGMCGRGQRDGVKTAPKETEAQAQGCKWRTRVQGGDHEFWTRRKQYRESG